MTRGGASSTSERARPSPCPPFLALSLCALFLSLPSRRSPSRRAAVAVPLLVVILAAFPPLSSRGRREQLALWMWCGRGEREEIGRGGSEDEKGMARAGAAASCRGLLQGEAAAAPPRQLPEREREVDRHPCRRRATTSSLGSLAPTTSRTLSRARTTHSDTQAPASTEPAAPRQPVSRLSSSSNPRASSLAPPVSLAGRCWRASGASCSPVALTVIGSYTHHR